ncbi:ATP-binding protein [Porifericola rhodea]|uniref:ATP-binding protein n=1 Tax=Porifericola rhodea TaxID=930972 RepID=UPI002665816A|nr:ATP-binding protein [Porifericola rhodea]WKN32853.1 ATP-binding protein [Porifericola rhodea]
MRVRVKLVELLSLLIIFVSLLILIGWVVNSNFLITFYGSTESGAESMKPITALSFTTFGIALLLEARRQRKIARLGISLILIFALINLWIRTTNTSLLSLSADMSMSAATCLVFLMSAVAFLLCSSPNNIYKTISESLIILGFYLAIFGLYSYAINFRAMYSIGIFSSFSLPTTLVFILTLISIALLYRGRGCMSIFYRKSLGGFIARRLLTIAFLLPIVTGFLVITATQIQLLNEELGIIVIATVLSLIMTLVGLKVSMIVHKIDYEKQVLLQRTQATNLQLEQAENQLKQRNQRLIAINRYLDDFVHAVAHNLRGVVTNIKGLMQVRDDNPGFQTDVIDQKLTISVNQLDDTLTNLIRLIELQNRADANIGNVNFERVLKEVTERHRAEMTLYHATIAVDFSEKDQILYSPDYIRNIIDQLVDNSIKYHYPGRDLQMNVRTQKVNGYTLLLFADNGMGIRTEVDQYKAFAPFRRLTNTGNGKGLGLFIVKSMVEKNGGKVEIDSKYEEGTKVKVYLKDYA